MINNTSREYQYLGERIQELLRKGKGVEPRMVQEYNKLGELLGVDPTRTASKISGTISNMPPSWMVYDTCSIIETKPKRNDALIALSEAQDKINELTEILEKIQKEPLILYTVDKITPDNKHCYVKKGETDLRIESCKNLERGDEVLLHPKTFQIVERLGRPPLEASRFAPDKIPNVVWVDIGGLEDAKQDLMEAIELPHKNKELFKFYNKPQVKGILLSGPPGCGKTMLGKAAANSLAKTYGKKGARTGFLYVKGPEVLDCYVGESEKTIRDMFFDAKRHKEEHGYPAIIFIDEADAILAARGTRNIGIGNTIVPMFLTEMDGLEESGAIVIIATNRPDILDPAIVRDGRIDRKVVIGRPNEENAKKILELNLKKVPVCKKLKLENIIENIIPVLFSNDCLVAKGIYLRDIINGAMIANLVSLAIAQAIGRDIESGKMSGLQLDDLKIAINRLQKQSFGIKHNLEEI